MATTVASITWEEYLRIPEDEGQKLELIEGEVIKMSRAKIAHEVVKANLTGIFGAWAVQSRLGKIFAETTFAISDISWPQPDLAFVAAERLKPLPERYMEFSPDLPIEVVSSETAAELDRKIDMYFRHGAKAVLAVYPTSRSIDLHRPDGASRKFHSRDVFEIPDILPGFSVPVSAVFDGL